MMHLAHVPHTQPGKDILTSDETVRAKSHLFSKGGVLQVFPWARYKQQGLARHLPHKEDEVQKRTEIYLTSHSKAALRLGVGVEENQAGRFPMVRKVKK